MPKLWWAHKFVALGNVVRCTIVSATATFSCCILTTWKRPGHLAFESQLRYSRYTARPSILPLNLKKVCQGTEIKFCDLSIVPLKSPCPTSIKSCNVNVFYVCIWAYHSHISKVALSVYLPPVKGQTRKNPAASCTDTESTSSGLTWIRWNNTIVEASGGLKAFAWELNQSSMTSASLCIQNISYACYFCIFRRRRLPYENKMCANGIKLVRESAAVSDCTKLSCVRKVGEHRIRKWSAYEIFWITVDDFCPSINLLRPERSSKTLLCWRASTPQGGT